MQTANELFDRALGLLDSAAESVSAGASAEQVDEEIKTLALLSVAQSLLNITRLLEVATAE